MDRVRRTKVEIEAGMTFEQKKKGYTLDDLDVPETLKKKKIEITTKNGDKTWETVDHEYKTIYKYKDHERVIEKEVPVVKEVRILNGTKKTEKTVDEILSEELGKCVWEWKTVKMDNKFRVGMLDELGKKGWKFAFITEWSLIDPSKKNKPHTISFQRPIFKS
jgi:hypothetical protein